MRDVLLNFLLPAFDWLTSYLAAQGFILYGKGGDSPDPPDYAGAAVATAQGNADAARIAAKANRVSQYTPYGNLVYSQQGGGPQFNQAGYDNAMQQYQTALSAYNAGGAGTSAPINAAGMYGSTTDDAGGSAATVNRGPAPVAPDRNSFITQGGDPDVWRSDVTLAPDQQKMLEQQNQISLGLGSTMNQGLGYVQNMLDSPLSTEGFTQVDPASVAGREQITATLLDRMQPSMDRTRQQRENALMIQGHNRGGEAWNAQEDDLARAENDQRMAAVLAGGTEQSRLLGLQQAQRQNQLAETSTLRNEPLATLNAVRTGAQPTNPQFTSVPQQQTTAGPNYLGAAQQQYGAQMDQYNAQQASNNGLMSGLFSLGGAALGAPAGTFAGPTGMFASFSDRRLKRNIHRIGKTPGGINIYSFEYVWGQPAVGVMADEVAHIPGAVHTHSSGYAMVDYSKVA